MNERKSKDANRFYRKGRYLCDLGGNLVGFTSITETDTAWRNLFHPWAYGPRDTCHLFRHVTRPDFHLSWQARLSFNKVTTLCCHGTQSDMEPVTMTSLKG